MDWSRIKSILILALVLANLALGYQVYRQKKMTQDASFSKAFEEEVRDLLAKKKIQIAPGVKLDKADLGSLRVEYESLPEEQINRAFFNNEALMNQYGLELVKLSLGKESLSIYNGRRLYYQNKLGFAKGKMTRAQAQDMALDFLRDRQIPTDDLELVKIDPWQAGYELTFKKVYEGVLVETSYTNFFLDGQGVHTMERVWLNIIKASERTVPLPSPSKTLLTLLDREDLGPVTVVGIEPCYYFNPQKQGYIEDITRAQQGRAIPAWRIVLDSGETIIVDILT